MTNNLNIKKHSNNPESNTHIHRKAITKLKQINQIRKSQFKPKHTLVKPNTKRAKKQYPITNQTSTQINRSKAQNKQNPSKNRLFSIPWQGKMNEERKNDFILLRRTWPHGFIHRWIKARITEKSAPRIGLEKHKIEWYFVNYFRERNVQGFSAELSFVASAILCFLLLLLLLCLSLILSTLTSSW